MFDRMRHVARYLAREVRIGRLILGDPRTPWIARVILGCGIAYALSPVDLVPDFIPVLGHLDDAVIVPLLFVTALALVPSEVIREHREAVRNSENGG